MKSSQAFLLAAGAGITQAELALYPSRGMPDSICTAKPYKQFLPLSTYVPATDYCYSRFPMFTAACATVTSQNTMTETYTGTARPTITHTGTTRTTITVATRTVKAVTVCSSTATSSPQNPRTVKREVRKACANGHLDKPGTNVAAISGATTITEAPASTTPTTTTISNLPPRRASSLAKKFSTVTKWGNSDPDGKKALSALTACRCIQTNPPCTTRTVLMPALIQTVYPPDNQPDTVTAQDKVTSTIRKTAKITPTVADGSCSGT